jgi:hypothetical protein
MPNQKISELTAIVTVDTSLDVLPIVDTSANTTKKISPTALKTALALDNVNNTSDANKPVSTAQQDALNAKVTGNTAIVAATKTKITYDAKGLVTAGNILDAADMPTGIDAANIGAGQVSSTEFGYLDGVTSAIQTQLNAKQATLVSGTNIKTINGATVLGAGDITIAGNPPSGVSGAIQFSNGSAFASDASNLFWDDTNKRLGVGTNAPSTRLHILSPNDPIGGNFGTRGNLFVATSESAAINVGGTLALGGYFAGTTNIATFGKINGKKESSSSGATDGYLSFETLQNAGNALIERMRMTSTGNIGIGETAPTSRLQVKGSGSTSATTSLLVQNSAGTQLMKLADDNGVVFGGVASLVNRARFGTYLQLKYDTPDIDIWQGGSGVGLRITNNGVLLAEFNDATGGGSTIRHSLMVGSASFASASARLQVDSTTQGFLPPRMTTTQKNAIATPATGLVLYDTTTNKLCCYNGSTWNDLF